MRNQPEPPTADDIEMLIDGLVGTLIPQADPVAQLGEREGAVEFPTREQPRLLDFLKSHDRVESRGGAGSVKTWLAVEKARRFTVADQRVALLCYSRRSADFLRRPVETMHNPRHRPAHGGGFHELGIAWGAARGADDSRPYWEQELPQQMVPRTAGLPVAELFDAVVIDEAQDLDQSWWPAVLPALRDPDNGCLYVFSEEGQPVFVRQGQSAEPLESYDLIQNLPNTKQIGSASSSLTTAQMKLLGGAGLLVQFVPCATDDALEVADDIAVELLDQGSPSESVGLLTTYRRHPVQVERQVAGQDAYSASYWHDDALFYGHVLGFKGLERPAVVLAVKRCQNEAPAREMPCVVLSWALDLLVVIGYLDLIERVGGEAVGRRLTTAISDDVRRVRGS